MRTFVLLLMFLLAACAPAVTLHPMENPERIPKDEYLGYVFSAGELEHLRVIFLKTPAAKVDVEASSADTQILPMSFQQAAEFVRRSDFPRTLDIQTVRYRGDIIGYLLTYLPLGVVRRTDEWLEVDFYERAGKIHFVVNKRFKASG